MLRILHHRASLWMLVLSVFILSIVPSISVLAGSNTFNGGGITTPGIGNGTPYPSTISVSGVVGNVTKVTVTLSSMSHTNPDDLDILLVGPGNQRVVLMSDSGGTTDINGVTLTFDDAAGVTLPPGNFIVSGTFTPSNSGGSDTWPSAPPGANGVLLSVFNGTAVNGTWSLYVVDDEATDSGNGSIGNWSLTITDDSAAPAFNSGAPAAGTVGTAYNHTFTASGNPAPTFAVTAGALPGGLNLASGGLLDGTPTANGTFNFTVTASNGVAPNATQDVTLVINAAAVAPAFTSGAPANGTLNVAYSHTFTASGNPAPTFSLTAGSLPPGLNLANGGLLDGTPTANGTFNFTVTASNGVVPDATQDVTVIISDAPAAPVFTSGAPADGTINVAYTHTFTASGNPAPTFTITAGALQPDLTLDSVSGVLSGTPTSTGTFTFTVTASNGVAPDATQNVTLVIGTEPVVVEPEEVELPEVPPATACTDVNFEDPGVIRSNFTNDADRAGLMCGLIAAGGDYRIWNGGPITFSSNIGSQTVLDLGVIAAVDVFSNSGQGGFVGDVNICLEGDGYIIYLNANSSPRVPQLWSNWTTDAFPGYTCTTLYAPGTVVLVERHP